MLCAAGRSHLLKIRPSWASTHSNRYRLSLCPCRSRLQPNRRAWSGIISSYADNALLKDDHRHRSAQGTRTNERPTYRSHSLLNLTVGHRLSRARWWTAGATRRSLTRHRSPSRAGRDPRGEQPGWHLCCCIGRRRDRLVGRFGLGQRRNQSAGAAGRWSTTSPRFPSRSPRSP